VQPHVTQLAQAGARVAGEEQLQHLVEQARRRHPFHQRREAADRLTRRRVERQPELRGEAYRAQHAHRVLAIARLRVADNPQHALLQVREPAVEVDHLFARRIEIQGVDGEVAPPRVFGLRTEDVVAKHPSVFVLQVRLFIL
jgi:hypothetical protein